MTRGCLTCAHAHYEKTPTGKLKRNEPVICRAPLPSMETIIAALKPIVPASMLWRFRKEPWAIAMWPDFGDDGSDCPVWAEQEKP